MYKNIETERVEIKLCLEEEEEEEVVDACACGGEW